MKRWNVIVELPAQRDVARAYSWLAEREPAAAERWFNGIYKTMGSLETLPERCPLAPESRYIGHEIREIFHGRRQNKYRILFTVSRNEVHILHVRHGARLSIGEKESSDE